MGRVLGIDPGSVRVGLAVSDPEGIIAHPLDVIARETAAEAIAIRVSELEIEEIVVGIPLRTDGSRGPEADEAESFAKALERKTNLPVARWDERLSTKQAERAMRSGGADSREQRGKVDKVAAAIVLQSYLDGRRAR
jgi:putative Holliday junction resolvase